MEIFTKHQEKIAHKIDPSSVSGNWRDWKWQMRNAVKTIEQFEKLTGITFSPEEKEAYKQTQSKFPLSITPYYLSLIKKDNYRNDPIFKQSFMDQRELIVTSCEMDDPLSEDHDSPVPGITHRYPDRVLFLVSNICAMYCRFCTRKRKVGDVDSIPGKDQIKQGLEYIRQTPQIRDVLLSGGDPFLLSDDYLDWILTELRAIPHVQIVRIGTRTPVVMPYRITDNLVNMLKKHHPVWINTHFNHPREITASAKEALAKMADAGIPLGNQSVLLGRCERLSPHHERIGTSDGYEPGKTLLLVSVRLIGRPLAFQNTSRKRHRNYGESDWPHQWVCCTHLCY